MTDMIRTMPLMGGKVVVAVHDVDHPSAEAFFSDIFDDLEKEGRRIQGIFDFFDPGSELAKLNRERDIKASKELAEVIGKGLSYSSETEGRYDITIGRRTLARKQGKELPDITSTYHDVKVSGRRISLLHPDALLDLGSIAKGYAADRIIDYMAGLGIEGGLVDARGDMRVFGPRTETVAIQHPRDRQRTINPFLLRDASVATSGDYNQYYGSYETSHLVGESDFCSVTVVGDLLADADAIASCVYFLGSAQAAKFLHLHPEVKAYAIDRSLNEYSYNGFRKILVQEACHGG
ncbi:MAG: FAD:protein FMN transferase [Candidatus Altiarchaeota archaeon]